MEKHSDQETFNQLVLEEVNRHESVIDVLILFSYKSDLIEELLKTNKVKLTLVSTDSGVESKEIDKWEEDPFKFIDLAMDTHSKFDLILLINPEEYLDKSGQNFSEIQKDVIRNLQMYLLKDSGLLIFLTHQQGFSLDNYLRPGADKLTKKVLTEEERETSKLQCYAFYR